MAELPPKNVAITPEQNAWLRANKGHRIMRGNLKAFSRRGTLWPSGTFVPEGPKSPVLNGRGAHGVGVPPTPRLRRSR